MQVIGFDLDPLGTQHRSYCYLTHSVDGGRVFTFPLFLSRISKVSQKVVMDQAWTLIFSCCFRAVFVLFGRDAQRFRNQRTFWGSLIWELGKISRKSGFIAGQIGERESWLVCDTRELNALSSWE